MRPIDGEEYMKLLKEQYLHHKAMGNNQISKAWQGAMQLLYDMPTLTPQNETPPCYQPDGDECAYQCYDGDDEPIDKCKECPLCYSDKQRHITPQNEWVSVEERLPLLRKNVLVCAYWHEHWGVYMGWNSGHGWTVSCGIGQRSDVQISHWMPLPAPPDRRPPEGEEDADEMPQL